MAPIVPRAASNFLLHLDGSADVSFINSVSGGELKANNTTQKIGATLYVQKNNTTVEVEPFTAEIGMAVSKPILDWFNESCQQRYSRRTGAWVMANQEFEIELIRNFYNALLVEATFPAMDASASKPAWLKLKIHPEFTKDEAESKGRKLRSEFSSKQLLWSPCNFRLNLDHSELNDVCGYVTKVDELTVKQNVKSLWMGAERFPQVEPTGVEFPNVSFHLPAAYAKPFQDWHKKMVVEGKTINDIKVSGSLEYLDHSTRHTLLELDLHDMGISAVVADKSAADAQDPQSVKVELFCHYMQLRYGSGMQ